MNKRIQEKKNYSVLISCNSENAEKKSELYKQSKLELDKKWKSPSGGALLLKRLYFALENLMTRLQEIHKLLKNFTT